MGALQYAREVLLYPVSKAGWPMLVIGAVLSMVMKITLGYAFLFGLLASVLWFGFLCATFFHLIVLSTSDKAGDAEFPDLTNLGEDIIVPAVRVIAVGIVALLPGILFAIFAPEILFNRDEVAQALAIFAIIYFPMALLAVAVLNNLLACNPVLVLTSIFRTALFYALCVILIIFVYYLYRWTIRQDIGNFWLRWAILSTVSFYTLMATARALGLLYREREDELDWV